MLTFKESGENRKCATNETCFNDVDRHTWLWPYMNIFPHCNLISSLNYTQLCVIFVITYITGLLFQRYLHRTFLIHLLEIYLITEKIRNNSSRSYMLAKQGREVKVRSPLSEINDQHIVTPHFWRDFLHVSLTFRSPHSYWCMDSAMRRLPETERSR